MYIYQVTVNDDVEAVKENFKTIAMMLKAESKISEPAAHWRTSRTFTKTSSPDQRSIDHVERTSVRTPKYCQ